MVVVADLSSGERIANTLLDTGWEVAAIGVKGLGGPDLTIGDFASSQQMRHLTFLKWQAFDLSHRLDPRRGPQPVQRHLADATVLDVGDVALPSVQIAR